MTGDWSRPLFGSILQKTRSFPLATSGHA